MSYHKLISLKIANILDNFYYSNLKKLYNESIDNLIKINKIPIFKPEYFIYMQYYFMYLFFYYISKKNVILYSTSLHLTHIGGCIFNQLNLKYNYNSLYNVKFLKDVNYLLFMYLFFFKILFLKLNLYKKIFMLFSFASFYFLKNVNYIYKERINCIENKTELNHFLKILIISPNKNYIEKIVYTTRFFTYSNYLFFINILLFFLL